MYDTMFAAAQDPGDLDWIDGDELDLYDRLFGDEQP